MRCEQCTVGPGAYEAEGAETAILEWYSLNGLACDIVSEDDGSYKDVFVGPIPPCEESIGHAVEIGYCGTCIHIASEQLTLCKNATFWIDDNGFRSSEIHRRADERERTNNENSRV